MNYLSHQCNKIVIVSEHFAPSSSATAQLISDLADGLALNGFSVSVITSTAGVTDTSYPVIRLSNEDSHTKNILIKASRGILFLLHAYAALACLREKSQLLIVSNPPFSPVLGVLMKFRFGLRYTFLLQDIFPRSACLSGLLPPKGPIVHLWKSLIRYSINQSFSTIVLSDSMSSRCQKEFAVPYPKLHVIPNWSIISQDELPDRINSLSDEWQISSSFNILYSGNFGRLHDVLTLLESARLLADHNIKFVFVGEGAKKSQILAYKNKYSLHNVMLKPYLPRSKVSLALRASDLSVVSQIPGAEDTVAPSKLYGILSASRPVLLISNHHCELARLLSHNRCGIVVSPGDVCQLAQSIYQAYLDPLKIKEMSINALNLYNTFYGFDRSLDLYKSTLNLHS